MTTNCVARIIIGLPVGEVDVDLDELPDDIGKYGNAFSGDIAAVGYTLHRADEGWATELDDGGGRKRKELEDLFFEETGQLPRMLLVVDIY